MTTRNPRSVGATKPDPKPDRLFRYSAIATIAGVAIALFAWLFPRPWRSPEPAKPETATQQQAKAATVVSDFVQAQEVSVPPNGTETGVPSPNPGQSLTINPPPITEPPPPKPFSTTFTLAEGRQKVLAHGDLSVSGEFNQVGQEVVPTIHLQARGREPEDFPLLAAGGRFEIEVGGKTYVVAVLSADSASRQFEIEVDLVR